MSYDIMNAPDTGWKAPNWLLILLMVLLAVAFTGAVLAEDEALTPGGVELTALADGTPAVGVDLAAVVAKPKTPDGRSKIARAWSATTNNIISHPAIYGSGGVLAALAASGTLQGLIGGGDEGKNKKIVNPNPKEPRPTPSVVIQGTGNEVSLPGEVVGDGPAVGIVGHDNTVTITGTEPPP